MPDARELLNQAEIVAGVENALRDWGTRLKGKCGYVPPGANTPLFVNVPDERRYVTEADRQATREVFALLAQHAKLLRRLLSEYGCHERIRPSMTGMLDLSGGVAPGEDMGGWWSRANEYAGEHLPSGRCSVPDELANWARELRTEASNMEGGVGERPEVKAQIGGEAPQPSPSYGNCPPRLPWSITIRTARGAVGFAFVGLECAVVVCALHWGSGENVFLRIISFWPFVTGVFAACVAAYTYLRRREGRKSQ